MLPMAFDHTPLPIFMIRRRVSRHLPSGEGSLLNEGLLTVLEVYRRKCLEVLA